MEISKVYNDAPCEYQTATQEKAYELLGKTGIDYARVATDPVITIEECAQIEEALGAPMVKTLLVCTRNETEYFLVVMPGDKRFKAGDFSRQADVSRVSFAPKERLPELLGTELGAASLLSMVEDPENRVSLYLDREILSSPEIALSDATNTGYLKIRTDDLVETVLPALNHPYQFFGEVK